MIDLAENPLDRRALVSLKKHLEIDQPNNKLLSVRKFFKIIYIPYTTFHFNNIQGIPHVLMVKGKPQGPGVRAVLIVET